MKSEYCLSSALKWWPNCRNLADCVSSCLFVNICCVSVSLFLIYDNLYLQLILSLQCNGFGVLKGFVLISFQSLHMSGFLYNNKQKRVIILFTSKEVIIILFDWKTTLPPQKVVIILLLGNLVISKISLLNFYAYNFTINVFKIFIVSDFYFSSLFSMKEFFRLLRCYFMFILFQENCLLIIIKNRYHQEKICVVQRKSKKSSKI